MLNRSLAKEVAVKLEKEIEPLVVSLNTAAKLTGVSDRHLRKYLDVIPHIRIGNRLLFRVDALREWLVAQETTERGEA
jgi:excisionase family DNA binding protein